MLRQSQQQKLQQKLSPQQIQYMKLLQVPTASLEERIKDELENNPALDADEHSRQDDPYDFDDKQDDNVPEDSPFEEGELEHVDMNDYLHDDDGSRSSGNYGDDDDDEPYRHVARVEQTFHDHLIAQLGLLNLNEQDYKVALQIIGSIDDDGYLRREPQAIVNDLAFNQNVEVSKNRVEELIESIKDFDPPGVGASDLRECLAEQLKRLDDRDPALAVARQIINKYFDEFTRKHYDKIKLRLKINDEQLRDAVGIILKLTPKPGSAYLSSSANNYIIPDFFVINNNGRLELTLNARNAPDLKVSDTYLQMQEEYNTQEKGNKRKKEALAFIRQKIDSAKWFIDSIRQRQHTLLVTMNAIMELQKNFFITGDRNTLRPMILRDIANRTNMDVSTISRVVNSKYVQTEFGVFLLKSFFSEGLVVDSGEEVSTVEVRDVIEKLIHEEDKDHPLSDGRLTDILTTQGYPVARRTVSKYREQLKIPVARLRKKA